jgi:hypothetical protein
MVILSQRAQSDVFPERLATRRRAFKFSEVPDDVPPHGEIPVVERYAHIIRFAILHRVAYAAEWRGFTPGEDSGRSPSVQSSRSAFNGTGRNSTGGAHLHTPNTIRGHMRTRQILEAHIRE